MLQIFWIGCRLGVGVGVWSEVQGCYWFRAYGYWGNFVHDVPFLTFFLAQVNTQLGIFLLQRLNGVGEHAVGGFFLGAVLCSEEGRHGGAYGYDGSVKLCFFR